MIVIAKLLEGSPKSNHMVCAIYWPNIPVNSEGVRHYLLVSDENWSGLTTATEDMCEVVDPNLSDFDLRKGANGRDMLVHWAAVEDALLDRMIEYDQAAMMEFRRRLEGGRPAIRV